MYNKNITHVTLTQSINSPIKIVNFLYVFSNLISTDMSKLINIIAIGDNFLCYCTELTSFDTTQLSSLITIGNNFLYNNNDDLVITIKKPSEYLHNKLLETNYVNIIKMYDKPIIHLVNDCVI